MTQKCEIRGIPVFMCMAVPPFNWRELIESFATLYDRLAWLDTDKLPTKIDVLDMELYLDSTAIRQLKVKFYFSNGRVEDITLEAPVPSLKSVIFLPLFETIYGTYTLLHDGKLPCFEFELVSNSPYLKKYTLYKALEDSWYWLKQDFSGVAKLIQHEPISILGTNKKFYFATFTGKVKLEELGIIAATHEFDLKLIRVEQLISETKSSDLCLSCIASALYNEHVGDLSLRDINFTRVGLIFRLCARTTLYLSNFVMSIVRKTPWLR